jgi:hypothetical protein
VAYEGGRPLRARLHPREPCGAVRVTRTRGPLQQRPRGAGLRESSAPRNGTWFDTAAFTDSSPGNLRTDDVLPSRDLRIRDAEVFWPVSGDPLAALTGTFPFPSSDHRLVWVDVRVG